MTKKQKAALAVAALEKEYPDALCSLTETEPYRLLIAVRLSAQCTDARVNLVTPVLFERFPTLEELALAPVEEVEEIIHSCGFFRAKARDIVGMCRMLVEQYDKKVPDSIEELLKLPGVGRKTANLICGDVYGKPAIVADTHLIRISNLLGLVDTKDPAKVEAQLKKIVEPEKSNDFCHRCVLHGRAVCVARRPDCPRCVMKDFCSYSLKNGHSD
ncbi:MAG: endonuclease III [Oscillospiraceae bacterium]|nr:endonuclease III [Oscillospiraceae bacterium]